MTRQPNQVRGPSLTERAHTRGRHARAGQSIVEFAVVLPVLLVLFLGIADLGRLFAAGIVTEAASRDGAEAAAQEYVQLVRGSMVDPATLYAAVDGKAASVTCAESQELLGVTLDGSGACTMPAIATCVHDAGFVVDGSAEPGDASCGTPPASANLSSCPRLTDPWSTSLDATGLPYVEVRICYRFDMLTQAPLFHVGPLYLEQTSNFVAAAY